MARLRMRSDRESIPNDTMPAVLNQIWMKKGKTPLMTLIL
jgi:hypothetical protein